MQPLGFGGGFFLLERAMRTHSNAGGMSEAGEFRELVGAEGDAECCAVGVTDSGAARGMDRTLALTLTLTRPIPSLSPDPHQDGGTVRGTDPTQTLTLTLTRPNPSPSPDPHQDGGAARGTDLLTPLALTAWEMISILPLCLLWLAATG